MKDREILENKLFDEYLEKDVTIILTGNIETMLVIHNCKILINDYRIILTDCKKEKIIIRTDEIIDISFNQCINIDLGNQNITIDC